MTPDATLAVSPTDFASIVLGEMGPLLAKIEVLVGEPANEAVANAAIADVHLIATTINTALGGCGSYTAPSICILSHEVRNALTAIGNILELLKHRPGEKLAAMGLKAVRHAIALLRGEEECEMFSLANLLEQSIGLFLPAAEQKGVSLLLTLSGDLPECYSRPTQVAQVLYNLIGNAIKFTPSQGSIVVSATLNADDQIVISVADTGYGIKDDLLSQLFKARVQAPETAHLGHGLGLSISYNLLRLLGGSIDVTTALGVGTDFRARLPVKCGAVPIAVPLVSRGMSMCTHLEMKGRGKVLVIEDEFLIRLMLVETLGDLGLECVEAANVKEALEQAATNSLELVFVDGLHGRGVALVNQLRGIALERNYHPVIIGFSGDNGLASAAVDGHLCKPYQGHELTALLRRFKILSSVD